MSSAAVIRQKVWLLRGSSVGSLMNAFVERYHRSYTYECVLVHRPSTLQEAMEVTKHYQEHYNWQRPHQGRSCQNMPPRTGFPRASSPARASKGSRPRSLARASAWASLCTACGL